MPPAVSIFNSDKADMLAGDLNYSRVDRGDWRHQGSVSAKVHRKGCLVECISCNNKALIALNTSLVLVLCSQSLRRRWLTGTSMRWRLRRGGRERTA